MGRVLGYMVIFFLVTGTSEKSCATIAWQSVAWFWRYCKKTMVLSLSKVPCILEGEPKTCSPVSGPRITSASCPLIGLGGALSKQGLPDHVNGLLSRIARLKNIISIVLFLYNMKLCHYWIDHFEKSLTLLVWLRQWRNIDCSTMRMACQLVTDVKWPSVVITVWGGRGLSNIIVQIINLIMAPFFNIYNSSCVLKCIITNNFVMLVRYTEWGWGDGVGGGWLAVGWNGC